MCSGRVPVVPRQGLRTAQRARRSLACLSERIAATVGEPTRALSSSLLTRGP